MVIEDSCKEDQTPKIDCLVFDLDDTLYPLSSGLSEAVLKNIEDYIVEKLGVERSKVPELSNQLYKNYGTTMAGLRAIGYTFDYDEYHSFIHGRLPYENLKPDPVLRNLLLSLPLRKVVYTNSDKIHAAKALNRLGIEDCFEGIICFETLNSTKDELTNNNDNIFDIVKYSVSRNMSIEPPKTPIICKPYEYAIEKAMKISNINPKKAIFFDDSIRNIQAGKRVGLHTVLVGKSERVKGADYALESIHNLREALPQLWAEAQKDEDTKIINKVKIETLVIA